MRARLRGWRPMRVAVLVFLVGLAVVAGLVWASSSVYDANEDRLVKLRVRELGFVLGGAVGGVQTPLASGAELAEATNGDEGRFREFMTAYVGPALQFDAAALWPIDAEQPSATSRLGVPLGIATDAERARRFIASVRESAKLYVVGILDGPRPRLGYAYRSPGAGGAIVYAESLLPASRRSRIASQSTFADLDYAIYIGRAQRADDLLVTSVKHLPIDGRHATTTVPFGSAALTLVVAPKGPLGGGFFHRLPLIIAIVGAVTALLAALVADRLAHRRREAEQLADTLDVVAAENHRMYNEQHSISQTLQHAMLPESLPEIPGAAAVARYVPAASGIEVGGDWYDLVALGEGRALLVIGDVTGHGLPASTTMAALRHATLALGSREHDPGRLLDLLADYVDFGGDGHFATVLCVVVDVAARELTIAAAGHPPPLLVDDHGPRYVEVSGGPPIGAPRPGPFATTRVDLPAAGGLLAFTDGLVERRGESLDVGLARLADAVGSDHRRLGEAVAALAEELASGAHDDDAAIVGLRWPA